MISPWGKMTPALKGNFKWDFFFSLSLPPVRLYHFYDTADSDAVKYRIFFEVLINDARNFAAAP